MNFIIHTLFFSTNSNNFKYTFKYMCAYKKETRTKELRKLKNNTRSLMRFFRGTCTARPKIPCIRLKIEKQRHHKITKSFERRTKRSEGRESNFEVAGNLPIRPAEDSSSHLAFVGRQKISQRLAYTQPDGKEKERKRKRERTTKCSRSERDRSS